MRVTTLFLCSLLLIAYSQVPFEKVQITNLPNLTQDVYHGWIQADIPTETYLYYQLFSADGTTFNKTSNIPLLLFLEGGPGDSSILSAWADFGPYGVDSNINITGPNVPSDVKFSIFKRKNSWCGPFHLLALDSPVFTGYSFSSKGFLADNTETVSNHLANFLERFYQIFDLSNNPLHIIGRSYGGHWAPGLTYELLKNRKGMLKDNKKVNIGGMILLSPLVSEKLQTGWADYFYAASVTDSNKRVLLKNIDYKLKEFLKLNQTVNASIGFTQEQAYIANMAPGVRVTTNISSDNVRRNHLPYNPNSYEVIAAMISPQTFFNFSYPGVQTGRDFLNIPGNIAFLEGYAAGPYILSGDLAIDYAFAVEYALEQGVPTTILGCQDDGIVIVSTVVNLANGLNWSGRNNFKMSERKIWRYSNGTVVGNYKKHKSLNLVTLYKSGHLMTMDQPDVMNQFMSYSVTNKWP